MMAGGFLLFVFMPLLILWAALGAGSLGVCVVAARRRNQVQRAVALVQQSSSLETDSDPQATSATLDRLIGAIPTDYLAAHITDSSVSEAASRTLAAWLVGRSHERLRAHASMTPRRFIRQRVNALRVLVRAQTEDALPLLEKALEDNDPQLVAVAVNLLGTLRDRAAASALIFALRRGIFSASRIASALDRFPLPIGDLLAPLASDDNPVVRFWGSTLLARYTDSEGVADDVARLVHDPDPKVRKAAIETLASSRRPDAATAALGLLGDPVWYVRAHAARALGELGRSDLAGQVMPLLADREWWVRQAAKESLAKMGPDVWRDLISCLDHPDAFARQGAAEVLQNVGVLDSLIVLQATSPHPAPDKIERLRKIAAVGGVRMTNAVLERADAHLASRIRALLDTLGLQVAGA